jgi:hypothetical protein
MLAALSRLYAFDVLSSLAFFRNPSATIDR